jgi:N-acetylmuramoyl-L-alanine amidase
LDYSNFSDSELLTLCCWREARGDWVSGQDYDAMRAVCHSVLSRVKKPGWWGHDIRSVILKPFQYSSFNPGNPEETLLPKNGDTTWATAWNAARAVLFANDPDLTEGAEYYYDSSITWPKAWGAETNYVLTLTLGRLKFFRQI